MNDILVIVGALVIGGGCGVLFYRVPRATLPQYRKSHRCGPLTCTGGAFWFASLLLMGIFRDAIGKWGRVGLFACAVVGYFMGVIGGALDRELRGFLGWFIASLGGVFLIVILCLF